MYSTFKEVMRNGDLMCFNLSMAPMSIKAVHAPEYVTEVIACWHVLMCFFFFCYTCALKLFTSACDFFAQFHFHKPQRVCLNLLRSADVDGECENYSEIHSTVRTKVFFFFLNPLRSSRSTFSKNKMDQKQAR